MAFDLGKHLDVGSVLLHPGSADEDRSQRAALDAVHLDVGLEAVHLAAEGVATGELMLRDAALDEGAPRNRADHLGSLRQAATQHARDLQQAVVRNPGRAQLRNHPARLQVLVAEGLLVRVGQRQPGGLARGEQVFERQAGLLGRLPRRVDGVHRKDAGERQEHEPVLLDRPLQLVEGNPLGGQLTEQLEPRLALWARRQPVEQPRLRELPVAVGFG